MARRGQFIPVEERFQRHICYVGDCIIWTGGVDAYGYGVLNGYPGKKAHRYAYERDHGPIPPGLVVNHLCRVRCCVNPGHLEIISHIENILHPDSRAVTKINADKKNCPKGHMFRKYTRTNGRDRRFCPTCQNEKKRAMRAREKQVPA